MNQPIARNLLGFRYLTFYAVFAAAFGFGLIAVQRRQASADKEGTGPGRPESKRPGRRPRRGDRGTGSLTATRRLLARFACPKSLGS